MSGIHGISGTPESAHPAPNPAPPRDPARNKIIWIVVLSGLVVFIGGGVILYKGMQWAKDRLVPNVDQSRATISSTMKESVYQNPAFGVTLRLPGQWDVSPGTGPIFCSFTREGTYLWLQNAPRLPSGTFEQMGENLKAQFADPSKVDVLSDEKFTLHGLPARRWVYRDKDDHNSQHGNCLVLGGTHTYFLNLTGAPNDEVWKTFLEHLPEAWELN
jgi:hypothetical protein